MTERPSDPRLTEARNPRTGAIDRADPREIVRRIQAEDRAVPMALQAEAGPIAELVERVAERLRQGGRLFYVGAGTSGRLGVLDAAECPPTFGTDPELVQGILAGGPEALLRSREGVEDDREAGQAALRDAGVAARDFVLGIAASGTTPFVGAALEEASARGAGVGFLSCTEPPPEIRTLADVTVTPLVGPEVIAGSTRMKAGTATKLVLNTLTTAVMIRLGKVYRNLMVDLRAVSEKLVDRSLRIVQEVAEVDRERARALLLEAGGSAKTAIAMARLQTDRFLAERLLDAHDGFLGAILETYRPGHRPGEYACYPEAPERSDAGPALLEALRAAPARAADALDSTDRTAPGGPATHAWAPAAHVAHLIEFESGAVRPRMERLRDADPGEVPDFADWMPSDPPPAADRSPEELASRFAEARAGTLAAVPEEEPAWRRRFRIGAHPVTLYQFLRGVAHHDRAHLQRMTERVHPALLGR